MFPNEGKYSNIKNPKICNWPVKMATPVNNKIVPPTFAIVDECFLKLFEKSKNLLIRIPEATKGIAKPIE